MVFVIVCWDCHHIDKLYKTWHLIPEVTGTDCELLLWRLPYRAGIANRHMLNTQEESSNWDFLLFTETKPFSDRVLFARTALNRSQHRPRSLCLFSRANTLTISTEPRHKHVHTKTVWAERVWVKEIEISVVTAGQLRGSDKQPTESQEWGGEGRGVAFKQPAFAHSRTCMLYIKVIVTELAKAPLSTCATCLCGDKRTVGMVGGCCKGRWRGGSEYKTAEHICGIHSLGNRSRILPACVATCQNLSS